MTVQKTLDWRFWVAMSACLMVAYLVVGGYQDNVAKGHRIDRLVAAAEAQDEASRQAAAEASAERLALLANQERLLRQAHRQGNRLQALEERQARLLAYLKAHGISVPAEFRTGNRPGRRPRKHPSTAELTEDPPGQAGEHGHPKAPSPNPLGAITDLLDNLLHPTKGQQ